MAPARWSPWTYLEFEDERSRPFFDLMDRVQATAPATVVDLGCGPGQLTAALAQRWPDARIQGIDSSPDMVDAANQHAAASVRFEVADLLDWSSSQPVDVMITNATLQWVSGHRDVLPRLIGQLSADGWLALQVPGNFDEPSHVLLRELSSDPRFADETRGVEWPSAYDAQTYLEDLTRLGCLVEAWETTYLHVLVGEDPVFRWISGTGARPVLQALEGEHRDAFVREYKALLRSAYPAGEFGTVLPFRRVFAVAHKGADDDSGRTAR